MFATMVNRWDSEVQRQSENFSLPGINDDLAANSLAFGFIGSWDVDLVCEALEKAVRVVVEKKVERTRNF